MPIVLGGCLLLAVFLVVAPGLPTQGNIVASILIIIFGPFRSPVSHILCSETLRHTSSVKQGTLATAWFSVFNQDVFLKVWKVHHKEAPCPVKK